MNWTIQSLSGFDFLYNVLVGASMFGGSGGGRYALLATIGAVLGLFVVALKAWITAGKEVDLHLPFVGALIFVMMFGHRVSVVVEEVVAPPGRETVRTRVVDDVPIGLAVLGHFISNMGLFLSERMDQAFSGTSGQNTGIPLSQGGYGRTLEILKMPMLLSDSRSSEPSFVRYRNNLATYYKNCTAPKLNRDMLGQGGSLWTNADMLEVIRSVSLDTTPVELASGAIQEQGCAQAWETLGLADTEKLNTAISGAFPRRVPLVAGDTGGESGTVDVLAEIDGALASLGVSSGTLTGEKMALAALIVGAADASSVQSLDGNLAAMQALMIRQAQAQRSVQWAAEESMFMRIIRPMMSFFEAITYALAPFVVFLLGTGKFGIDLARKYLVLPIWVVLWMPLLSITQLYTDMQLASALQGLDLAMQDQGGASIAMVHEAFEEIIRVAGVSGMLSAAVPSLAMMLLFGGAVAATSFAGRLQGGDHVNEKMAAGDMVSPGAALNMDHTRMQNAMGAQALSGAAPMNYKMSETLSTATGSTTSAMATASANVGYAAEQALSSGVATSKAAQDASAVAWDRALSANKDKVLSFLESRSAEEIRALAAQGTVTHSETDTIEGGARVSPGQIAGAIFGAASKEADAARKAGQAARYPKLAGMGSNVAAMAAVALLSGVSGGLKTKSDDIESGSSSSSHSESERTSQSRDDREALTEALQASYRTNLGQSIISNASLSDAFTSSDKVSTALGEAQQIQRAYQTQASHQSQSGIDQSFTESQVASRIVTALGGAGAQTQDQLDNLMSRLTTTFGSDAVEAARFGVSHTSGLSPSDSGFDAAVAMRAAFKSGDPLSGHETDAALLRTELATLLTGSGEMGARPDFAEHQGVAEGVGFGNVASAGAHVHEGGSTLAASAMSTLSGTEETINNGNIVGPGEHIRAQLRDDVGGDWDRPDLSLGGALQGGDFAKAGEILAKQMGSSEPAGLGEGGTSVFPSVAPAAIATGAELMVPMAAASTGFGSTQLASGAKAVGSRLAGYSAIYEAGNAAFNPQEVAAGASPEEGALEAVTSHVAANTLSSLSFGLLPDSHEGRVREVVNAAVYEEAFRTMSDGQRESYQNLLDAQRYSSRDHLPPDPLALLTTAQRAHVMEVGEVARAREVARQEQILAAGSRN